MSNVAAHAGGQQARREDFEVRRAAAPMVGAAAAGDQGCHFPAPHPMRVYCQPAAFHTVNGMHYHNLSVAYGSSRPLSRYY